MLQAVASPMMAAPAFAALMGLDATLVLVTLVASIALTPITAPLFAHVFVGETLKLSPLALGIKLFAILAGSALVAVVLRRIAGPAAIARRRDEIDGLNILVAFIFITAVMENVAARFVAEPLVVLWLAALAFAVCFAVQGVTTLVFWKAGRERAFVLGLYGLAAQHGIDAGGNRRSPARPHLAFFCTLPVSHLPVAAAVQADRATADGPIAAFALTVRGIFADFRPIDAAVRA